MKITNKYNLPSMVVEAVTSKHDLQKPNTYYVTQLIYPETPTILSKRHDNELEEDASNKIWALLGSAVHDVLDRISGSNRLKEERLELDFPDLGVKVIGRPDIYEEGKENILYDYKITSCFTYIYGSMIETYEQQLNIYAYMLKKYGFKVDKLKIVMIFRDWSKMKAMSSPDYPNIQVKTIDIKLWDEATQEKFIKDRLKRLIAAEKLTDDELPICSEKDRWTKPTKWAVMKTGRKSALRLLDTEEAAKEWEEGYVKAKPADKTHILCREGEDTKCLNYCSANKFCKYYIKKYGKREERK